MNIAEARQQAWQDSKETFYLVDHLKRGLRLLSCVGLIHYYMFWKVAKHIKLYPTEINATGAGWLREIITGVSNVFDDPIE